MAKKKPPRPSVAKRTTADPVAELMDTVEAGESTPAPERPSVQVSQRPDVQTSQHRSAAGDERPPKPRGRAIEWRRGRILADGSRRGAGWVKRATLYLDPLLADQLDDVARAADTDMSSLVNEAIRRYLEEA